MVASLEPRKAYCRLPTVSREKKARPDTAAVIRGLLTEAGFGAQEHATDGGPPVVFGLRSVDEELPSWLMYPRYHVRPVDPLDEWRHDPFDTVIKNGRLLAGGVEKRRGLRIGDLPEFELTRFEIGRGPFIVRFRLTRDKTGKGHLTFEGPELADAMLAYVHKRVARGEEPTPDLPWMGAL